MKEYTIIFEKGENSWGAYVPDLPVCFAVAETREEVEKLIKEAVEIHIADLQAKGETLPEPSHFAVSITVAA
jgi:predicted RNase H-like HicB family nuclease